MHVRWFALSAAIWGSLGCLGAAQARLASAVSGTPLAWSDALALSFADAWAWMVLTPFVAALAVRFPLARGRALRSLLVLGAGAVAASAAHAGLHFLADVFAPLRHSGAFGATHFEELVTHHLLITPGIYAAIVAITQAATASREARERAISQARLAAELSEARLRALAAQLQPHFLFNTLNAISALVHKDPEAAERTLANLGDLLRAVLHATDEAEVTLGRELAMLESYLAIERQRYGERILFEVEFPDELRDARVPILLLQPLVENAVRHGVAPRPGPGRVRLAAVRKGDRLELSIEDDGVGLASGGGGHGVGLRATRARLSEMFGAEARLDLVPREGGGTRVSCSLPLGKGVVK